MYNTKCRRNLQKIITLSLYSQHKVDDIIWHCWTYLILFSCQWHYINSESQNIQIIIKQQLLKKSRNLEINFGVCIFCSLVTMPFLVLQNQEYVILLYIFMNKFHNMLYTFSLEELNRRSFTTWQLCKS